MDQGVLQGEVIHVNEDGWVIINRGAQDGVVEGQKFVVLGERNPRQIRNLFPAEGGGAPARPVVLRVDTAYELLRVILVERQCCVAISDRVPPERIPQPYLGPQGELLLYTPPPPDWRYDALDLDEAASQDASAQGDEAAPDEAGAETAEDAEDEEAIEPIAQQERLWDGALPLNALQVGDEVVLALPYHSGAWGGGHAAATTSMIPDQSAESALSANTPPEPYDWLKTS